MTEEAQVKQLPDKRITELRNFHNGWYQHIYKITAPWGPKQAKLGQTTLRYADMNSISVDDVLEVMTLYMQSPSEFIKEKAKHSFEYFCQDFNKHYVEWQKMVPKAHKVEKKPINDDPAWDLTSWHAKRHYFDTRFNECSDDDIREFLQKQGIGALSTFAKFPMLLKFPPKMFNERMFRIAKELFGRDEMVKHFKEGQVLFGDI